MEISTSAMKEGGRRSIICLKITSSEAISSNACLSSEAFGLADDVFSVAVFHS